MEPVKIAPVAPAVAGATELMHMETTNSAIAVEVIQASSSLASTAKYVTAVAKHARTKTNAAPVKMDRARMKRGSAESV